MMLATLTSISAAYLANAALAIAANDGGPEAEQLVSGAVELTAYQLRVQPKDKRATHGNLGFRLGAANVAVR